MVNLEEWGDYSKSAGAIRCIERNLKSGNRHRILIAGVNNVLRRNGFVPEDKDYALGLIGEKTPNSTSNRASRRVCKKLNR